MKDCRVSVEFKDCPKTNVLYICDFFLLSNKKEHVCNYLIFGQFIEQKRERRVFTRLSVQSLLYERWIMSVTVFSLLSLFVRVLERPEMQRRRFGCAQIPIKVPITKGYSWLCHRWELRMREILDLRCD